MIGDMIALIANVSLALSFVLALIFGLAQVKAAARDRRERLTLETLRQFQTREFAELMHFISSHKMPTTRETLNALPREEHIMFTQFAQQMESLGILVAEKLVSIELVDKVLGSYVMTTWQKYETVFKSMRAKDPFIGEYFEWLAVQMDTRMKENPREPFYKT